MSNDDQDSGVRDVNEFINGPGKWVFTVIAGLLVAWFLISWVSG